MKDYYVRAWNFVDDNGVPILEVDEEMTHEEYVNIVCGKFACESTALLRPISAATITEALKNEKCNP